MLIIRNVLYTLFGRKLTTFSEKLIEGIKRVKKFNYLCGLLIFILTINLSIIIPVQAQDSFSTVSILPPSQIVRESDGQAIVSIRIDGCRVSPPTRFTSTVTIPISIRGISNAPSTPGVDFLFPSSVEIKSLEASPGNVVQRDITLTILDDSIIELSESFEVILGDPIIQSFASRFGCGAAYLFEASVFGDRLAINTGSNSAQVTITDDDAPPTAVLFSAPDITTPGSTSFTFTVVYSDDTAIDIATLDDKDITVSSSFGLISAVFDGVEPNSDGTPRTATYSITPPGGSWDISDNRTYNIILNANQVTDISGKPVEAGSLGNFNVIIPDTEPPIASLPSEPPPGNPPDVSSRGGRSYNFAVTFSDNVSVNVTSLDDNDITVVGPSGPIATQPSQTINASFDDTNCTGNSTPCTATYSITPPGGRWNNDDDGIYEITLNGNAVADSSNNTVIADKLGGFTVRINVAPDIVEIDAAPLIAEPIEREITPDVIDEFTLTAADEDGDALTWRIDESPSNGTASISNSSVSNSQSFTYTPSSGLGTLPQTDTFTIQVNDGNNQNNNDTVRVNVKINQLVDQSPVITQGNVVRLIIDKDNPVSVILNVTHQTDGLLTWSILRDSDHGTVSLSDNSTNNSQLVMYMPDLNFAGDDSFTVQIIDSEGMTNTITVYITVRMFRSNFE